MAHGATYARARLTPPERKRHVLYDTGHYVPESQSGAEIAAWPDRYLGPVK